jgi:hypothetical protein
VSLPGPQELLGLAVIGDRQAHELRLLGREGAVMEPPALEVAPLVVGSVARRRVTCAMTVRVPADLGALEQRARGEVLHCADRALDLGDLLLGLSCIGLGHGVDGIGSWRYYYRQSAADATPQATRREVRSFH